MEVSARRAYNLLRELAYERVSCSEAEKAAANRLMREALEAGAEAHIEEFSVPCGKVNSAKLCVTKPYTKEYAVTGYERARSTPGLDAEFLYVEDCEDVNLANCEGKIIMPNGYLRYWGYKKLMEAKPAAIITFSGATYDRPSEVDHDIRKLREPLTEAFGDCVALHLRVGDAVEIVRRGATEMHIELDSEKYDGVSQNVCATITGEEFPDEVISFGAHYDSVYFSTGVYDNMSGSVIIMELLRYFAKHKPARTMKFNWFGSEEQGLLGSKAWVEAHKDELEKHVLMINVDVAAATLGANRAPVLATDAAVSYVDALMREAGIACGVKGDIYSSDCVPFADNGVPAVNFCRFGARGADHIHNRRDNLKSGYIDEKALDITLRQTLFFAKRVDCARAFPIKREISEEIKGKIDEYLFRKEPKKK